MLLGALPMERERDAKRFGIHTMHGWVRSTLQDVASPIETNHDTLIGFEVLMKLNSPNT